MKKILKSTLFILFILVVLPILYAYSSYPVDYVNRIFRVGNADVYDYQKLSERSINASTSPFEFSPKGDEDRVRAQFEAVAKVDDFDSFLEKNRTQAFIVIQEDSLLYEQYFNRTSRDSIVTSFSIAKSITSALIGIAISEGYINSVYDPITNYLPELAKRDPAFENITIRNLLMMSSGIRYEEFPFVNGDNVKTYYHPNLRQLALEDTRIVGTPGEIFLYNNYHPLLLGMILERATGTSVTNYLQEKIWQPIGMQYPGSWSLDENGFEKMESGINARAIDFAKFGRLYLHNGNWSGVQVVPAEWVAESTQADTSVDYPNYYYDDFIFANGQGFYKYMWWGIQSGAQTYDFIAYGNLGQYIYVSPEKELIIIRFGESYGEYGGSQGWLDLFYRFARDFVE